ncbi:tRNA (32-2'-O)-methyltransferase regulator THADA-like isoform X2 [Rhineura floridana]|uniref:tRNA (32-2'-O)-methyltransferase regulator THADA-like isoform X2 n=1 Tax=Rhineura floridana TaxID=261503 RepID=UPI002AC7F98C|nr:tRNA (32-2'-O)-methyltransferase regulator THADA-like isoform X2 [Rhineura floridana]
MSAEQALEEGLRFYKALLGQAEGLRGTCQVCLLVMEKLKQFAGASVKRCRDKHLEEAFQQLAGMGNGLWELDHGNVMPLVRCVLACQMETTSSSGSFHRLEKIVVKLSEENGPLVSEQVNRCMGGLTEGTEAMSSGDLQTVCMFVEGSALGRSYWRSNLMPLLRCVAATFDLILQEQGARNEEWHYITAKMCLQLFKWMPEEFLPLAWDETENNRTLQRILSSLVQTIARKAACKDTRLLAGTAVGMLVNTAPESQKGASAVLGLYQLLSLDGCPIEPRQDAKVDDHKGKCRFGALIVSPSSWSSDGLERMVLTRGLLACCKKKILSCQLDDGTWQACLLLDVLFPAILVLREEPNYCSFQVFYLWLRRVRESLDDIWEAKGGRMLADRSRLLETLSHFLWNNAESPVEGVSEFIHSSFQLLLEIYSLECDHFEDSERPLYGQFLQRVLLMPWQARARYFPLISILPYLGPEKVLDTYKDLSQHLLNCLSTNHLCPVASDLYKSILQLQRKAWAEGQEHVPEEEELAQKWGRHWLPALSSALTSPISSLQNNTSNYLLGWTLRLFPASYALLAKSFRSRDPSQLRAWVTLLNVQKTIVGVLPADPESLERLSSCLFSKEENVRLATLGLLCSAPRTSQALSEMEVQLLKESLPLSMNCDSSSFRQFLQAMVKKALVRLRDSSLAVLRQKAVGEKEGLAGKDPERPLGQAVEFVEWLLQLCISSLRSGSSFQRKKTALLLLAAIMETCTDTWSPERKKGQPPRNVVALLSWARSQGCWDFFSRSHALTLLSCLQDSTNEIRELASELLVRYFPPAFPESIAVALFEQAKEAMSSPRVPEAEAGAVLMKTILQKSDSLMLKRTLPEAMEEPSVQCLSLAFLKHLLNVLGVHFARARHDLLLAARTSSIHGVISALRRCLLEVPEVAASVLKAELVQHWRLFLGSLVSTVRNVSSFLLGVLQSKRSSSFDQQAAPSFAEMGDAIGFLIEQGKGPGLHNEDDFVLLSEEHSLILTCCWVSVKEIGLLLGGLAEKILPLAPPAACGHLLPLQVVKMAAEVFQEILLTCRHWGAVEGCSLGFTKFCTTLLSHPDPELQDIPRTVLEQGLALLNSPRSCSVTRRAAGFPMLFLCIVVGEDPAKPRPLLASCLERLLALAGEPLPKDWDQTVDLPQVSAVHVLQTLVRGSGLGTALHQYITPMVTLFLEALGSPSWAMRNAAIQLFGALTVRLLGQKRSQEGRCDQDGVSPEALFSRYPHLKSILLRELAMAAEVSVSSGPQRGKFHLCPSLYAVLTFLAKLHPSTDTQNRDTVCFLEPLVQLSGNPIYAVRSMAAKALVPLVPATEYGEVLFQLASGLPLPGDALCHNTLHGCLLQIQALLAQALSVSCLLPDRLLSISRQMEDCIWLLTSRQQCPLVRTAYLQAVSLLVGSCSESFTQRIWEIVSSELANTKPILKPGLSQVQIGSAAFCQRAVGFLCCEAMRSGCPERVGELCLLLQSGNIDVQVALLTWVIENEERSGLNSSKGLQLTLLEKLGHVLKEKTDSVLLKLYLEAFVHLYSNLSSQNLPFSHKPLGAVLTESKEILLSMVESDDLSPECLRYALCVLSLLLTPSAEDYPLLEQWCSVIERCSDPLSSEVLRMAAAKSLKIAGVELLQKAGESSSSSLRAIALRLTDAAVCLLQDEDQEVRQEASIFASLVVQQQQIASGLAPQSSCVLLQSNKGLLCLLEFLLEKFGNCPEAFATLVRHLPTADLSEALTELEAQGGASLYKEDEPNVYAEPAILSQTLLPFLFQLLGRASISPRLWEAMQRWLKATGPVVFCSLHRCRLWWGQADSISLHLKALGCPKVDIAVTALLVKAALVVHILEVQERRSQPSIERIGFTSQELRCAILSIQKLLAQCGMVLMIDIEMER